MGPRLRWVLGLPRHVYARGWGRDADWLRNVQSGGPVEVTIGRESFTAAYRMLPVDEAVHVLAAYERRNALMRPLIRWVLSPLLGWRFDGTPAARQRLVEQLPLVALRPR